MSHNLHETLNGYATFTAIGKRGKPWHGLGTMVQEAQTWEEAIKLAQLNWTVSKHRFNSPIDNRPVEAYGIFRDDTKQFLGTVGDVYTPIQNEKAFDFVDTLLESTQGAHYESAGALGNGSRVWCLARVPFDLTIAGTQDRNENYVLFETSHDGTMSATCKLTSVRVVCQNTLTLALNSSGASVKIRHSSSSNEKLEAAKRMMTGIQQSVKTLEEKLNFLAKKRVTKEVSEQVMSNLFGKDWKESSRKKNQIHEIGMLFYSNDRNEIPEIKGSAYNLLNAITEYTDHYRSVRVTDSKRYMSIDNVRKESAIFGGTGESLKSKALDYILDAVKIAPDMEVRQLSNVDNIMNMVSF